MADEVVSASTGSETAPAPVSGGASATPAPAAAAADTTSTMKPGGGFDFKQARENFNARKGEPAAVASAAAPAIEEKKSPAVVGAAPAATPVAGEFIEYKGSKIPAAIFDKALEYGKAWPGGVADYLDKMLANGGDPRVVQSQFHKSVEKKFAEAAQMRRQYEDGMAEVARLKAAFASPPAAPAPAAAPEDDVLLNDPLFGPKFKAMNEKMAAMEKMLSARGDGPDATVTFLANQQIGEIRQQYGDAALMRAAQNMGIPLSDDMTPNLAGLPTAKALQVAQYMKSWAKDYAESGGMYETTIGGVLDAVPDLKDLPNIRKLAQNESYSRLYSKLQAKAYAEQGGVPTKEQVEFIAKESVRDILVDLQKDNRRKAAVLAGAPAPIVSSGSSPVVRPEAPKMDDMIARKPDGTFDARASKMRVLQAQDAVPKT